MYVVNYSDFNYFYNVILLVLNVIKKQENLIWLLNSIMIELIFLMIIMVMLLD